MNTKPVQMEQLAPGNVGLIADAHIHPAQGIEIPDAVLAAFSNVHTILALGDMGEARGLDQLATHASVRGVIGIDDALEDERLAGRVRLFDVDGIAIGATFDAAALGLLADNEAPAAAEDLAGAMTAVFGRKVDIVVCAASHRPYTALIGSVLFVNPGSPTLPVQGPHGRTGTIAILEIGGGVARVRHVFV
jgi:uncharacterized protein